MLLYVGHFDKLSDHTPTSSVTTLQQNHFNLYHSHKKQAQFFEYAPINPADLYDEI